MSAEQSAWMPRCKSMQGIGGLTGHVCHLWPRQSKAFESSPFMVKACIRTSRKFIPARLIAVLRLANRSNTCPMLGINAKEHVAFCTWRLTGRS